MNYTNYDENDIAIEAHQRLQREVDPAFTEPTAVFVWTGENRAYIDVDDEEHDRVYEAVAAHLKIDVDDVNSWLWKRFERLIVDIEEEIANQVAE